jgi:predicted lipoprotein with Yx(FWY)xxD motif
MTREGGAPMTLVRHLSVLWMLTLAFTISTAEAQRVTKVAQMATLPDSSKDYPQTVSVANSDPGPIYVDTRGATLYTLDSAAARFRGGRPANKYCIGHCAEMWTPLAANAEDKPVGAWTIVDGVQGGQWAYKGELVFTFNGDKQPGAVGGNGLNNHLWSIIPITPPAPRFTAPADVSAALEGGDFVLTDDKGRALYTRDDRSCDVSSCAELIPFAAGMASRPVGDWTINRATDRAQWLYRGKLVYVGAAGEAWQMPSGGTLVRP